MLDWINAVQAMQELQMEIPVNLKVMFVCDCLPVCFCMHCKGTN